jgi:outer membrane lipase/esterase
MKIRIQSYTLLILVIAASPARSQTPPLYDSIYCFGFSWTDTRGIGCPWTLPDFYGNRASNGPMWPELLSTNLGLAYVATNNFANCGDTTSDVIIQVNAFRAPTNLVGTICFVWSGASDFLYNPNNFTNDTVWTGRIRTWVNNNTNAVLRLYRKGVRSIVVQNCFDLSVLPHFVREFGTNASNQLKFRERIASFNAALAAAIQQPTVDAPDLRLFLVDVYSGLKTIHADPASFGFTKLFPDALSDRALTDKTFSGPGKDYLYWDDLHPTSKGHELISAWNLQIIRTSVLERLRLQATSSGVTTLHMEKLQIGREYKLQSSADLLDWRDVQSFTAVAGTNQWPGAIGGSRVSFFRLTWRP